MIRGDPACEPDTVFRFLYTGLNKKKIIFNFREFNNNLSHRPSFFIIHEFIDCSNCFSLFCSLFISSIPLSSKMLLSNRPCLQKIAFFCEKYSKSGHGRERHKYIVMYFSLKSSAVGDLSTAKCFSQRSLYGFQACIFLQCKYTKHILQERNYF